ncbi:hypothetical protein PTKIN_Ptkin14bG0063800 [Pterospermum kingtungense]
MADFIAAAASNAVGTLLVKPITSRFHYLFGFNKIVEDLLKEKDILTIEKGRVQRNVEEAIMQSEVIEMYVEQWLIQAEIVLNDVQCLEVRIEENKRCFRWCPNWSNRYRLSKMMVEKAMNIRELVECSQFERCGHRAALLGLEFLECTGYLVSQSSTFAFNEIMEALKNDEFNMIGVYGMAGVGKTTLVKHVGNEAKRLQLVDQVIMVVISQLPHIGKIQEKIADFLDLKLERATREGRAEELWLRLANKEKVLIILDDVWSELDLKDIGIPLGQNHKGCTIIFTTRIRRVCKSMGSQIAVSLGVLDEDEGWNLFKMNARLENASPDIIEVAKEVSKECVGLPLAIVTLASALRSTEDPNAWKSALHKLRSAELTDFTDIENSVYLSLKISYDHLRREAAKKCFLLCSLYPEDHLIDEEDLVRNAWGLGLYHYTVSIDEARSEVFVEIQHLKDSNLLLEDEQTR